MQLPKKKTIIIALSIFGFVFLVLGGFLLWRVNQQKTLAPEDSEAAQSHICIHNICFSIVDEYFTIGASEDEKNSCPAGSNFISSTFTHDYEGSSKVVTCRRYVDTGSSCSINNAPCTPSVPSTPSPPSPPTPSITDCEIRQSSDMTKPVKSRCLDRGAFTYECGHFCYLPSNGPDCCGKESPTPTPTPSPTDPCPARPDHCDRREGYGTQVSKDGVNWSKSVDIGWGESVTIKTYITPSRKANHFTFALYNRENKSGKTTVCIPGTKPAWETDGRCPANTLHFILSHPDKTTKRNVETLTVTAEELFVVDKNSNWDGTEVKNIQMNAYTRDTSCGGTSLPRSECVVYVNLDESILPEPKAQSECGLNAGEYKISQTDYSSKEDISFCASGTLYFKDVLASPLSISFPEKGETVTWTCKVEGGESTPCTAQRDNSWCGDMYCDTSTENVLTCPQDCPGVCGDGMCTHEENQQTCPQDCGYPISSSSNAPVLEQQEVVPQQPVVVPEVPTTEKIPETGIFDDIERPVLIGGILVFLGITWSWIGKGMYISVSFLGKLYRKTIIGIRDIKENVRLKKRVNQIVKDRERKKKFEKKISKRF